MVVLTYSRGGVDALSNCVGLGLVASRTGMDLALLGKDEDITPSRPIELVSLLLQDYFSEKGNPDDFYRVATSLGMDYCINKIGIEIWRNNPELLTTKLNEIRQTLETGMASIKQGRYESDDVKKLKDLVYDMGYWALEVAGMCKEGVI